MSEAYNMELNNNRDVPENEKNYIRIIDNIQIE